MTIALSPTWHPGAAVGLSTSDSGIEGCGVKDYEALLVDLTPLA